MFLKTTLSTALTALFLAAPALAGITIDDAYVRAAGPLAKAGAAFMVIRNDGATDDRLIAAASTAAQRVELHTHVDLGDGVMRMRQVTEGFTIRAGGQHVLARGGDHVMFMGLTGPWADGDAVPVTLTFERAGDIALTIPVDLSR